MRRLTLREVQEQHDGVLPPDAVLRADDEPANPAGPPAPQPAAGAFPRRPRRAERFEVLNAFADFGLAGLTGAEVKVWLVLFRDTRAASGTARTGQEDIARRTGLSRRGVQVALAGLTAKGRVAVVRRGRLNDGPSTYRVHPTGPGSAHPGTAWLGALPCRQPANRGAPIPEGTSATPPLAAPTSHTRSKSVRAVGSE